MVATLELLKVELLRVGGVVGRKNNVLHFEDHPMIYVPHDVICGGAYISMRLAQLANALYGIVVIPVNESRSFVVTIRLPVKVFPKVFVPWELYSVVLLLLTQVILSI